MTTSDNLISPETLLTAYCEGAFPMGDHGEIYWFSPDPRGIIPLDTFHIPHGLKKTLKKCPFEIRINTAFRKVIEGCADREETWIDSKIRKSYLRLYELGWAHSVETWRDQRLVGGLYGVSIRGVFFGESMFSRETDASKVALVHLVERMKARQMTLLDTQWTTPHLCRFGAIEIPRSDYLKRLGRALNQKVSFMP